MDLHTTKNHQKEHHARLSHILFCTTELKKSIKINKEISGERKTNGSANRNAYQHNVTRTHTKTGGATFSFFSLCALRFEPVAPELSVDLQSVSRGR